MPRRIRLLFSETEAECDICNVKTSRSVQHYQTKNLGINYVGPWRHPLAPYFVAQDGTPSPVHPQPGGIGYRHWLGIVLGASDGKIRREPAPVVERYLQSGGDDLRLWAFGYDMDNMKARCWQDGVMPLFICPPEIEEGFASDVARLVRSADLAASETRGQLKRALFKPGSDVKGDISFISGRFWQETEPGFFGLLPSLRQALQQGRDTTAILEGWHKLLIQTAGRIFDDVSQTGAFDAADPKRIALAWRDLQRALSSKKMRETVGLPDNAPKNKQTKKK